jgi:hypothetical protein
VVLANIRRADPSVDGCCCCGRSGVLSGCSANGGGTNLPRVSRTALQEDIAHRLADAGKMPESVTCKQDLVGEVGATARCDVVVSATNNFEPIVTVTALDGSAVDYEMMPAVSRRQLEGVVARLIAHAGTRGVKAVSCESGIEGRVGAVVNCDVEAVGLLARRIIRVSAVNGLMMDLDLDPARMRLRPVRPSS